MARRRAEDPVADRVDVGVDARPHLAGPQQPAVLGGSGRQAQVATARPTGDQAGVEQPAERGDVGLLGQQRADRGGRAVGVRGRLPVDGSRRGSRGRRRCVQRLVGGEAEHPHRPVVLDDHPGRVEPAVVHAGPVR
jgi:hypothetical protein